MPPYFPHLGHEGLRSDPKTLLRTPVTPLGGPGRLSFESLCRATWKTASSVYSGAVETPIPQAAMACGWAEHARQDSNLQPAD